MRPVTVNAFALAAANASLAVFVIRFAVVALCLQSSTQHLAVLQNAHALASAGCRAEVEQA